MLAPDDLFDLSGFAHAELFSGVEFAWEALDRLPGYVARAFGVAEDAARERQRELVEVAPGAMVEEGAIVVGPALIGAGCEVYAGSLVRGPVILGKGVVVGHGSEVVGSVALNGALISHLNYVGDSVLGAGVNLGAGAMCANMKLGRGTVDVCVGERAHDTGREKLGAILGDGVRAGCNVVFNPGTVVGPRTWIYAGACLRGYYPGDHVIKVTQELEILERR